MNPARFILRLLYEHWGEQWPVYQNPSLTKTRSARQPAEEFPAARRWSITYTANDWLLAGVVSLRELTAELKSIEDKALQLPIQRTEVNR